MILERTTQDKTSPIHDQKVIHFQATKPKKGFAIKTYYIFPDSGRNFEPSKE